MAIAFRAVGAIAASTGVDVTPALPTGWANNDIGILLAVCKDVNDTPTVTGWTQIATFDRSTVARYWVYGRRLQTGDTAPLFDKDTTTGATYASIIAFSGCAESGTAWEVVGASGTSALEPYSIPGITTLSANSMVLALFAGEDDTNSVFTMTGTDPAAYTENYAESAVGTGACIVYAYAVRTAAGATGTITAAPNLAEHGAGFIAIALKEQVAGSGTGRLVNGCLVNGLLTGYLS